MTWLFTCAIMREDGKTVDFGVLGLPSRPFEFLGGVPNKGDKSTAVTYRPFSATLRGCGAIIFEERKTKPKERPRIPKWILSSM